MVKRNKMLDFLYVMLLVLVGLFASYFICAYTYLNNPMVEESNFLAKTFRTLDDRDFIFFGDFTDSFVYVNSEKTSLTDCRYRSSFFTFDSDSGTLSFAVIDASTVYSDHFNLYFYMSSSD